MKPLDALGAQLNEEVLVRLKNGWEIRGQLKAFDIHVNLVLADAEYKDGDIDRKFKMVFIRGDMVIFVS